MYVTRVLNPLSILNIALVSIILVVAHSTASEFGTGGGEGPQVTSDSSLGVPQAWGLDTMLPLMIQIRHDPIDTLLTSSEVPGAFGISSCRIYIIRYLDLRNQVCGPRTIATTYMYIYMCIYVYLLPTIKVLHDLIYKNPTKHGGIVHIAGLTSIEP